jgi:hypothetical protein
MQTMVIHVHDIVSPDQFTLIKAIGSLGALLWIPEIEDMNGYLVLMISNSHRLHDLQMIQSNLDILIGNVLDAFALTDPSKIIDKIKLQILPNLIEDIRRFSPAIQYSTEIFECYNAIFRLCFVLSNHQTLSCDIANRFSSMDSLKHMLSGGYWKSAGAWVCASPKVRNVLHNDHFIQRHLGWVASLMPSVGVYFPIQTAGLS